MYDRLRRATLASFVMLIIQFGIGMAVNLYVKVPKSDHGAGIGHALTAGPYGITVHIVVGLLLILSAIGLVVQSVMARHRLMMVTSIIALVAILGAAGTGSAFVSDSQAGASLGMAVLSLVALFCYGLDLFVLGSPAAA